jgi:hypothetical protein
VQLYDEDVKGLYFAGALYAAELAERFSDYFEPVAEEEE